MHETAKGVGHEENELTITGRHNSSQILPSAVLCIIAQPLSCATVTVEILYNTCHVSLRCRDLAGSSLAMSF